MMRGLPPVLMAAKELPETSVDTSSANVSASSRHTCAGAVSNPDGPGVSSNCFRNSSEEDLGTVDTSDPAGPSPRRSVVSDLR